MITMQETVGVDAARTSLAFNNLVEFNTRVNWDVYGPILFVLIIVAALMLWHKDYVVWLCKNNFVTRWRGKRRMEQERENKVRESVSDNIQDAIDTAFLEGDINAEERRWAFYTIGRAGFPDLLTRAQREKLEAEEKAKQEAKDTGKNTLATVHVL